jgi:hypothetical protein
MIDLRCEKRVRVRNGTRTAHVSKQFKWRVIGTVVAQANEVIE